MEFFSPCVFFTFFKLYKWYQITQRITNGSIQNNGILVSHYWEDLSWIISAIRMRKTSMITKHSGKPLNNSYMIKVTSNHKMSLVVKEEIIAAGEYDISEVLNIFFSRITGSLTMQNVQTLISLLIIGDPIIKYIVNCSNHLPFFFVVQNRTEVLKENVSWKFRKHIKILIYL